MKKQLSFPVHPLIAAALVVGALFVVLFAAFGITRWVSAGQVMGRVALAEIDLGGKNLDEAHNAVRSLAIGRIARVARFEVEGAEVQLEPGYTGLHFDEDSLVDQAMAVGREGNLPNQFLFWLTNIFSTTQLTLEGALNDEATEQLFDEWDNHVIDQPIYAGSVELLDGELVAVYPQTGVGVDREPAKEVLLQALLAEEKETHQIPTRTVVPVLTNADVDAALADAQRMLAAPITLTYDGDQATFDVSQLAEAFVSETVIQSNPEIVNFFDPEAVDSLLDPIRSEFEAAPVDARFQINDNNTVSVIPGRNGTRIDEVETASRLYDASQTPTRSGQLPVVEGAEPRVTTEYLESLNVTHLVSQFTTYHDCCRNRVTNIHLMADAIRGTIVLPGETFSINEHVGERTPEKGFLEDGAIVGGEIVETYGGGISQFATTFYNAVFWGGYEDVEHRPHTLYFSRYPEGVEATLAWQSIDVKFRNNREHAILIDTRYTDTSITVRFFGFNHGRTLVGDQSGGQLNIRVASEGGPDALHVKLDRSERYNFTDPPSPEYRADPDLPADAERRIQSEGQGWTIDVIRTILRGGTDLIEERKWVVRYHPARAIYEVHPCMVPGTSTPCPTTTTATTTTTVPDTTTTSAPPATTTTTTPDDDDDGES